MSEMTGAMGGAAGGGDDDKEGGSGGSGGKGGEGGKGGKDWDSAPVKKEFLELLEVLPFSHPSDLPFSLPHSARYSPRRFYNSMIIFARRDLERRTGSTSLPRNS